MRWGEPYGQRKRSVLILRCAAEGGASKDEGGWGSITSPQFLEQKRPPDPYPAAFFNLDASDYWMTTTLVLRPGRTRL